MLSYKLLTPGPLTTSTTVKEKMLADHCTWDDEYKEITQWIRKKLLEIADVDDKVYTSILIQGSGSFAVEAMLMNCIGDEDKVLILSNGEYGKRMGEIAEKIGIHHSIYTMNFNEIPDPMKIKEIMEKDIKITHVAMVHSETTTGILNNIEEISQVVKESGKKFLVDAMSSFGGIPIDFQTMDLDVLVSSANKCIQGVPGFSFLICKREVMEDMKGKAKSLCLDIYGQWKEMEKDGKWRFTSPTHAVLAFEQAIKELEEEGGVLARNQRYRENQRKLVERLEEIGLSTYIEKPLQSPIITTFLYPENKKFSFEEMYTFIKKRGYAIYPGKLTDQDTFRIGNIGEIYIEDMEHVADILEEYLTLMDGCKNE